MTDTRKGPPPDCGVEIMADGKRWSCTRPKGHDRVEGATTDDLIHQCLAIENPSDGRDYLFTWSGPVLHERLTGVFA